MKISTNINRLISENYFKDKNSYNMLFKENLNYYIATRCAHYSDQDNTRARFTIFGCYHGNFVANDIFLTDKAFNVNKENYLCPIVTLNSSIKLIKEDDGSYTPKK